MIPYLPKSQLLAQWRELNSIFKNQDKHILINYVYEYGKEDLYIYSFMVANEMTDRGYIINKLDNYREYFKDVERNKIWTKKPFQRHHTDCYLIQCFYNLQEKYDRGQKDFSKEEYKKLEKFIQEELKI